MTLEKVVEWNMGFFFNFQFKEDFFMFSKKKKKGLRELKRDAPSWYFYM